MASKTHTAGTKKKQAAATESSLSIQEQTRAFLAAGGKVELVDKGVSGQQNVSGPKHIVLGNQ